MMLQTARFYFFSELIGQPVIEQNPDGWAAMIRQSKTILARFCEAESVSLRVQRKSWLPSWNWKGRFVSAY